MKVNVQISALGDEASALTSKTGHVRAFARLAQTGVTELLAQWVAAEMQRPDAEPIDVLIGLARYTIQTQASLSASFLKVEGLDDVQAAYKTLIEEEFARTFLIAKANGAGKPA